MKVNVLLSRKFTEQDIRFLTSNCSKEINFIEPAEFTKTALEDCAKKERIHAVLGDGHKNLDFALFADLKFIQVPWNGLDSVDLSSIPDHIIVCNSHSNSIATAELAFSLMVSVVKEIPLHDSYLRRNEWLRPGSAVGFRPPPLLKDLKYAYFGFGKIGSQIHKYVQALGGNHIAISRTQRSKQSDLEFSSLDDLKAGRVPFDVLFVSVPLTSETRGILDNSFFKSLNRQVYIVNVARGAIFDEVALFDSVKRGDVLLAMDSWFLYPQRGGSVGMPSNLPFSELEGVVMSPHRGGFVKDEIPHLIDVVQNLNRFSKGESLINQIDVKKGY